MIKFNVSAALFRAASHTVSNDEDTSYRLEEAARAFGNVELYVGDDGKIHA